MVRERDVMMEEGQRDAMLLPLKVEEGDKEMRAASKSWKRRGNGFFLRTSGKESSPADTLTVAH